MSYYKPIFYFEKPYGSDRPLADLIESELRRYILTLEHLSGHAINDNDIRKITITYFKNEERDPPGRAASAVPLGARAGYMPRSGSTR